MIIPEHDYTPRERTVCDVLAPLFNVHRMLNVGMRQPGDPRNLWWLNICKANDIEAHVLEVFEPNCHELRAAGVENVVCGDVRHVTKLYDQPFDVILWWHGPEHLPKVEVPAAIEGLWQLTAGTLFVGCPLGEEPQGICYGNQHERHLSAWLPEELAALGFETSVVRDQRPYPHITAWKKRGERESSSVERAKSQQTMPAAPTASANEAGTLVTEADTIAVYSVAGDQTPNTERVGTANQSPGTIRRVAIVYDGRQRPETTGTYVLRALQQLAAAGELEEVTHIAPEEAGNFVGRTFDLCLVIDDGRDYPLPLKLGPVAYWAIDTHLDFDRSLRRARQADVVFAAQKDGAERLRQAGIVTARWLPLACDPQIHGKQELPKEREICFVGNLFPGPRSDLVRLLQRYFCSMFVGNAYFEEMARIYSASKIVFNRSLANDVNMRVFEALTSGSLLMTNDLTENGQHELFRDGVHLATYRTGEELLDKARYYLRRDDLRERIAAAGRAEVLAKHTYRHRMEEILAVVARANDQCKLQNAKCKLEVRASAELGARSAERAEGTRGSGDTETQGREGSGQRIVNGLCLVSADDHGQRAGILTNSATGIRRSSPQSKIQNPKSAHDPSYFTFARPELLGLIPTTAATVLEIGCGAGLLGETIKARQPCEVVGIELDEQAAALARTRLDLVFAGDLEQMEITVWDDYYDVVTLGDVLEHLADPGRQLARIRKWLKPNGIVVASIPNVRHHSVVKSLLDGNFSYEPTGLLDRTHLGFYTRRDIQDLFHEAGYAITSWTAVPGPGYDEWAQQGRTPNIDLGRLTLLNLPEEEAQEFFVYQWLVVASPLARVVSGCEHLANSNGSPFRRDSGNGDGSHAAPAAPIGTAPSPTTILPVASSLPSCLLLMVTYNRLEYTKVALEAVLALDYPGRLEIVIFDNASTDGTVAYLRERLRDDPRARLIESPINRGVVYPMNAVWFGHWASGGCEPPVELLAKVDNDTWVPPDLLRRLADCHIRSQRLGVLSGFHFRADGEALADESRVQTFDGVRLLSQPYVGGCAVVVRKSVLDRLGPIPCQTDGHPLPFMDSGWTFYQQRMTDEGLVNGYPWPLIHVDHMEDTRSPRCIRSAEHQEYKQQQRGMSLEQFTQELCVWRPNWEEKASEPHIESGQLRVETATKPTPRSRIRFIQDFRRDFDQFEFLGSPFAFVRFADGERAICAGQPIDGADGWRYAGGASQFREALLAALRFNDPDYYLGLSDGCCDRAAKEWYLGQITVPLAQVTFSNIFVNGNYERFRRLDLSASATVASEGGDYWVPSDIMRSNFDLDALVERLLPVDRTILISAGPAAAIIIHRYWQRATPEKRQAIVDVGSAIDELTKGCKTRQYQMPGSRTADLVCTW